MPELRKDPIVGRWVIISTERAKRPQDFKVDKEESNDVPCPFCEGNETHTPPEIYAIRTSGSNKNSHGWQLRVVPSISPLLRIEGNLDRKGKGIYDVMNGIGAHEIIIETKNHIANIADLDKNQISNVIRTYIARIQDLNNDPRFKYVLIFKNYGMQAGGSKIKHTTSQLIATPINPKRVKEELTGANTYFNYHERCIFCDIIRQELNFGERVVLNKDGFVVFSPFASRFPFELWILPNKHSYDFTRITQDEIDKLANVLKTILSKLKNALGDAPYNYILHNAPFFRPKAGYWKTIEQDFHWHIEIIPRLTSVAGFEWGSGIYINPTPPEEAAKYLRETI